MTQTIVIAGLGLIGGSLATNIKQTTDHHLIGYDISKKTLDYCMLNGIIDEAINDFDTAAQKADYLILATPVTRTVELIDKLNSIAFEKPVTITDVSSVKAPIMEVANKLTSNLITFIGGHPMAGSHKKGIQAAKGHLFENAIYILTPDNNCSLAKIDQLKDILKGTKSNFLTLEPKEHDEMTSVISHFPHLIASSLVHQAKSWQKTHEYIPKLAAGGFRDITRIASSNPAMWQDIFFHNRQGMSNLLEDWISEMTSLKSLLETGDKISMYHYLEQAKEYRDGLDGKEKGAIPSFYDLYVDIHDQPGALLSVIELLANKEISIINIEILEIREGITGVLRLSFQNKTAQLASNEILIDHSYETMIGD
ncbi:prephenate dehydrogenase [Aquibacillus saliphilus]|uniref:prephenate dehydrogenase n=1 Tax=Aquibacillus saliphilus TaxID=1909422 RepID=UPI001CF07321|nr:prephenate dehydrogenase [Aquibacillus saliphilus]